MQTINILRTTLETEDFGFFLVDAFHDDGKVHTLNLYQIEDGIVGEQMHHFNAQNLPDLVERLNYVLEDME